MAELEPTPPPADPFPDLTILDVPGCAIYAGTGEIIQLIPAHPVAIRILARDANGDPLLIQPA